MAEATIMTDRPRGRLIWRAIGFALFGIGFVGAFVPLLPTVIFWILAVLALQRSDPAFAARIRAWPKFGPAVSAYLDHGVIARSGKIAALCAMSLSAGLLIWRLETGPILGAALLCLAGAALYVATRPGAPPPPES